MRELIIGAGEAKERRKNIHVGGDESYQNPVTLDRNPLHMPDVVWDLEQHPLPFEDNSFDEIHAYDVLEHLGHQGDWQFFFKEFSEYWRILRPLGVLCGTVPKWDSVWALGEPSHRRVINHATLTFLSQLEYSRQVGKTALSDFRFCYQADFNIGLADYKDESFFFALQAIKPSRITI